MAVDHFRGNVFRQCRPNHTDFAATVRASTRHPYRFNPPGVGGLYVALSPQTARAELERQADRIGIPIAQFAPRVMLQIEAELQRVLDLTDPDVRAANGLSLEDLRSDDYTRCQAVAREAKRKGYEAIRYPSATGVGENLAIFYDSLDPGSRVEITMHEILHLTA